MATSSDSVDGVTLGSSLSLESTQVETPAPILEISNHNEVEISKIEKASAPDTQKTPRAKPNFEKSPNAIHGSVTQVDRNAQDTLLTVCEMMLINLAKLTLSVKEVQSSMISLSTNRKKKKSRRAHDPTPEE